MSIHPLAQQTYDVFVGWFQRDRFPLKIAQLGALIMSTSLIDILIMAAGLWDKNYPPVFNDDNRFKNTVGLVLIVFGICLKLWFYYRDGASTYTEKLRKLYNVYPNLTNDQKQIEFHEIYGILLDTRITDRLMRHPTSPVLVVKNYVRGRSVLKMQGEWFDWKSKKHNIYKNIYAFISLAMFFFGLIAIYVGGIYRFYPPNVPNGEWIGYTFVAEGVIMMLGALLNFGDVSKYGAAQNVMDANPTAVTE